MMFPCVKRPISHTASESRVQNAVFYTRQVNLVCKMPCFTYDLGENDDPVCKNPCFTYGK